MRTSAMLVAVLAMAGCPAPTNVEPAPSQLGCGKDTDCKGERICVAQRCVFPSEAAPPVAANEAPTTVSPAPPSATTAAPNTAASSPPAPRPSPSDAAASGQRPEPRCGCAEGDVMCATKCAQRGNAAGPSTWPGDEITPPNQGCQCAKGDLMCTMRCAQKK
jgi:hypothetical protein